MHFACVALQIHDALHDALGSNASEACYLGHGVEGKSFFPVSAWSIVNIDWRQTAAGSWPERGATAGNIV